MISSGDIDERACWDEYMEAYETCINKTARKNAPWYVVPADHKWYARLITSRIVLSELENVDPRWPVLSEEAAGKFRLYREMLAAEVDPEEKKEEDDGKKLRPSDTAVGIALKNDRQALSDYETKLSQAFEAHRTAAGENKEKTKDRFLEIAGEYMEIGSAFHKDREENAAEESPAVLEEETDAPPEEE